jgi:hypothetical protein
MRRRDVALVSEAVQKERRTGNEEARAGNATQLAAKVIVARRMGRSSRRLDVGGQMEGCRLDPHVRHGHGHRRCQLESKQQGGTQHASPEPRA